MAVNTTKIARRRNLKLASVEEVLAEIDRLEAACRSGNLRQLRNWSASQNLTHLAAWINYAYDGFPIKPPPFFIRWFLRWQLAGILKRGMSPGVFIPGVPGGTTGAEEIPLADAAERLRQALRRLISDEPAPHESPAFGALSYSDRILLNLRHAELHLSFLDY